MRLLPLLVALTLALTGCTLPDPDKQDGGAGGNGGNGGGGGGDAPQCEPGVDGCPCPEDMANKANNETGCVPVDTVTFDIQVSGSGTYEVGIPFPHGSWCLSGDDWLEAMRETRGLDGYEVRSVDRGQVLWLQAHGDAKYLAVLDVSNRTVCNTLRYDPWSIDPDPAEDAMEVFAEDEVTATIYLRTAREGCAELRQFEGPASGGWSVVPQRFNGTTCQ